VLWGEVAAAAAGHGLRGLPTPPIIILTSSADRAQFGAKINSYWFIAKRHQFYSHRQPRKHPGQAGPNADAPAKRSPPRR
jgi:hypothetical protein